MKLVRHNRKHFLRTHSNKIAVSGLAMVLGAGIFMVAQADEAISEFTRRVYVGAGIGGTFLEPKTPHPSLTVSSNTDSGFHIVAGYDFTTRLSAELYYADLGAAEIAFLGDDIGDVNYQVFGLSAIGYLFNSRTGFRARSQGSGMATREGLSLFGRIGVGGVSADSNLDYKVNHSAHMALGLGAEYGFKNGFAVRGEYRALDTDQQYATVSIVKRFGKVEKLLPVVPVAMPAIPAVSRAISADVPQTNEPLPQTQSFSGTPTVNFALDESVITPSAASKLDEVVAILGASNLNIMLEGHADAIASEQYNYDLSMRRAESVRRYLADKGIDAAQMSIRGFGEARPLADNDTAEGRAKNRRVDIRIN